MTSKSKKNLKGKIPPIDAQRTSKLIQEFIKMRVKEASAEGIVIGLSGGVDSAVTCVLAVQALGPEKVFPIFLRNKNSLPSDIEDIKALCEILQLELLEEEEQQKA